MLADRRNRSQADCTRNCTKSKIADRLILGLDSTAEVLAKAIIDNLLEVTRTLNANVQKMTLRSRIWSYYLEIAQRKLILKVVLSIRAAMMYHNKVPELDKIRWNIVHKQIAL